MDYYAQSLKMHEKLGGKLSVVSKAPLKTSEDLSIAYTPGVAEPSKAVAAEPSLAYTYTLKKNSVAVVSDGSAVLGLGNIGPYGAIPVMEGKCALFSAFAGIDAFPICLDTQEPEEIVKAVKQIAPVFGGINLEDIAAPKCFAVEQALIEALDIPVFHDDQHGTAIVASAAVLNALKLTNRSIENIKVAISGAGAAGAAVAKMLLSLGVGSVIVTDSRGILTPGREGMNPSKEALAQITNPERLSGGLAEAVRGADIFIGVSAPGILTGDMVRSMAPNACIFAMANPVPEISPEEARSAGAAIIGTGRSDYPNQINNVLAFPGIFRGALDARAGKITQEMKTAAAKALAAVNEAKLTPDTLLPSPFDERVVPAVAGAVKACAT